VGCLQGTCPNGACDTTLMVCVGCLSSSMCTPTAPLCDPGSRTCRKGCLTGGDCTGTQGTPLCNTDAGVCAQCLNDANCPDAQAPHCNTSTGRCVGCLSDANCSGLTPHCNGTRCVECLTSAQCQRPGDLCLADFRCGN
jgi:hypothetical protein